MILSEKTRDIAKCRLMDVLRQDRTNLSKKELALMQLDILAALSAYLDMERDRAHISIAKSATQSSTHLTFTVPIRAVKPRR